MFKQVIIVRNDLKLPKGKLSAQVAHASVETVLKTDKDIVSKWRLNGQMKIVLKVESLNDLIKYFNQAKDNNIPCCLITDAGKTVIAPGTKTCVGIGPYNEEAIDNIVKDLKLL
jgi:peptidyl-tRNA hydrolase, PTH2 family